MEDTRRHIRPFQDADEPAVAAVWHRSGLAAYPYLPTWQALTLEHARRVFHDVIRANCAIWVGTLVEAHQDELKGYDTSKGTIRFQANTPLPDDLVRKLMQARIAENMG